MRIAVLSEGFSLWGGGADFLALLMDALVQVHGAHQIHLLVPGYGPRRILATARSDAKALLVRLIKRRLIASTHHSTELLERAAQLRAIPTHSVDHGAKALETKLASISADVVIPCMQVLGREFAVPWVGYLADFQHRYFPQFFSDDERAERDRYFERMLTSAEAVIVNSMHAASDIDRFHPKHPTRIFSLPFAPPFRGDIIAEPSSPILSLYKIPEKYFLVCNQFWIHKDHATAFRAFSEFARTTRAHDVQLICTGAMVDYRFPAYMDELKSLLDRLGLKDRVRLLGHIPKLHQLHLVKNCLAIIQPTTFEGGPGGGAAYDAASLGVPALLSNISVNREASFPGLQFFEVGNPSELAARMSSVFEGAKGHTSVEQLQAWSNERRFALGQILIDACKFVA